MPALRHLLHRPRPRPGRAGRRHRRRAEHEALPRRGARDGRRHRALVRVADHWAPDRARPLAARDTGDAGHVRHAHRDHLGRPLPAPGPDTPQTEGERPGPGRAINPAGRSACRPGRLDGGRIRAPPDAGGLQHRPGRGRPAFHLRGRPGRRARQRAAEGLHAHRGSAGPELRVVQGDRVRVTLVNHLPDRTSIHWHGLRLPDAEDGVAGITQNAVRPGGSYVYEFVATDVGTYWYHSHQDTYYQLPRGLFGSLMVLPRGGVAESRDYTLVVHTGADGSSVAINGSHRLHLDAAPGDTVRLRIVNANDPPLDGSPIRPALLGAGYRVVALDGHDLNAPQVIGPERIPVGMGQRADLVFTMPPSGEVELAGLIHHTPGNPFATEPVSPVTIGDGPAPTAVKLDSLPRFDLTTYGAAAPDPIADATAFDVTREIGLGGSPAFYNGTY
ncbi:MAG: hypothetical protein E6J00_14940, partial [Chloroflexi bacterium]